jgi:hypothetical protein
MDAILQSRRKRVKGPGPGSPPAPPPSAGTPTSGAPDAVVAKELPIPDEATDTALGTNVRGCGGWPPTIGEAVRLVGLLTAWATALPLLVA